MFFSFEILISKICFVKKETVYIKIIQPTLIKVNNIHRK